MARKLKSDKFLFTATLLLVCTSIVMVYSASAVLAMDKFHEPYYFLFKQAADQGAVVRLVVLDRPQQIPRFAVARMLVHEHDQRLGAGALGFEHPVQEVSVA